MSNTGWGASAAGFKALGPVGSDTIHGHLQGNLRIQGFLGWGSWDKGSRATT
jgi:hypothetical protein